MPAGDSLYREKSRDWGLLQEAVLNILGTGAVILPMIDRFQGQPTATTFKTVGEEQITFTWSETGPGGTPWAVPPDLTSEDSYQGSIPFLDFDGFTDEADSPDAAFWTRALAPLSMGAWVNFKDGDGTSSTILGKYDSVADTREWIFGTNSSDQVRVELYDEDVAGNDVIKTVSDVAVAASGWQYLLFTYDGGADASGINIYYDGEIVASTDTDNGNFVSMRDTAAKIMLGYFSNTPGALFDGKMAAGPLGPFFTPAELSADAVRRLDNLGRRALAA